MHDHDCNHNCLEFRDLSEDDRNKVMNLINDGTITVIKIVDDQGQTKESLMITEFMEEFGLVDKETIHLNEVSGIVKKLISKLDEEKLAVLKEIREKES